MEIPPVKVHFPKKDVKDLKKQFEEILSSGRLILGEYTEKFEEEFAKYVGVKHAVAVNNGTSALEICLRIFRVTGKEVIVPTNTNFATPASVLHAGGKLRFIDNDPESFSITPEDVQKAINKKTAGVIIVHIGGIITPRVDEIKRLCKGAGLFLLEDAAHAHGSSLNGKMAGSFGNAAAFSFYPTKVITSLEGGMITTNFSKIANRARIYRDQGKQSYGRNLHKVLGNSWRMSEIHAAAGISQLRRINQFIKERNTVAKYYDRELTDLPTINPLSISPSLRCNYYKYIAILDKGLSRSKIKKCMAGKYKIRLSGEVYEIPSHRQPVFKGKYKGGSFPNADEICKRHICLPIYASMTKKESEYILDSLIKYVN